MTLRLTRIVETALYVEDLDRAASFYTALFGSQIVRRDERFCALRIADEQVLLLFRRGASLAPSVVAGGVIPPHDGSGQLHVCFGVASGDLAGWEARLRASGISIESKVEWPGGAVSVYFRDPDQHAVELATPGLWTDASVRASG